MGFLDRFRQQLGLATDDVDEQGRPRMVNPQAPVGAPPVVVAPVAQAPLQQPAQQAPALPPPDAPGPTQVDAGPAPMDAINYDHTTGRPSISQSAAAVGTPAENQMAEYQALQGWEPHGGKRGFKNSLKAGLMYASDAVKANPNDPVTALIAGFGTGALGATASPNFKNRLTKDWELKKTGGDLQQQLGLQKEQAQIAQAQLNPYYRGIALNQGQQRIDNSSTLNAAHIKRWETMGAEKGREQAMKEYQNGNYDDNPEMLDYLGKTYGNGQSLTPVKTAVTVGGQTYNVKPDTAARVTAETTEGAARRQQQDAQFGKAEAGRMQRSGDSIAARGVGRGVQRVAPKVAAAANKLFKQYNDALSMEQRATAGLPANDPRRAAAQSNRENLWRQIEGTYGGMYETEGPNGTGAVRMKGPSAPVAEDPQIRAYANEHFGGDYAKALDNALKTGYQPPQ